MKLIVPYRDRLENLKVFAEKYKGFDILVVEQANRKLFNGVAKMMTYSIELF
jgi:hypothetical protein